MVLVCRSEDKEGNGWIYRNIGEKEKCLISLKEYWKMYIFQLPKKEIPNWSFEIFIEYNYKSSTWSCVFAVMVVWLLVYAVEDALMLQEGG